MQLETDGRRVGRELAALACQTAERGMAEETVAERDRELRRWLAGLANEAGLGAREDAVGNLFFRLEGADTSLPAVATGSHLDGEAEVDDGRLGVLGGLEALRAIRRSGARPRRSIELAVMLAPTGFGVGSLGSRLVAGALEANEADDLVRADGRTLREVRQAEGFRGDLCGLRLEPGHWHAWVELQVEDGAWLERAGCSLGVVTGIAGGAGLRYTVVGEQGAAGGLLMPARRDALCAAAELVLQVENTARRSGSTETVATVGRLTISPGTEDSVPGRVELSVDLRETEVERRDRALAQIRAAVGRIVADRGVRVKETVLRVDDPVACSPQLLDVLERAAKGRGARTTRMLCRARPDALCLARVVPVGMVSVPRHDGLRDGADDRGSADEAISLGTATLADALLELAEDARAGRAARKEEGAR